MRRFRFTFVFRLLFFVGLALVSALSLFRIAYGPRLSRDPWKLAEPQHSESISSDSILHDRVTPLQQQIQASPVLACVGFNCEPERNAAAAADNLFILIGVVYRFEQAAYVMMARDTWVQDARKARRVAVRFFCVDGQVSESLPDTFHVTSSSDMPYIFQVIEMVASLYHPTFFVRVDVRSYVHTGRLLNELQQLCTSAGCNDDHVWAGVLVKDKAVPTSGDARAEEYRDKTGMSTYIPHMQARAYALSGSLMSSMVFMHEHVGLKPFRSESMALALWLLAMSVHRVDLSGVFQQTSCCFVGSMADRVLVDMCAPVSPVIVYDLVAPSQMLALHDELRRCQHS